MIDDIVLREEERQRVIAAIETLPEREREMLVLKEFEGLRYREIADLVIDTGRQSVQVLTRGLLEQLATRWKASA